MAKKNRSPSEKKDVFLTPIKKKSKGKQSDISKHSGKKPVRTVRAPPQGSILRSTTHSGFSKSLFVSDPSKNTNVPVFVFSLLTAFQAVFSASTTQEMRTQYRTTFEAFMKEKLPHFSTDSQVLLRTEVLNNPDLALFNMFIFQSILVSLPPTAPSAISDAEPVKKKNQDSDEQDSIESTGEYSPHNSAKGMGNPESPLRKKSKIIMLRNEFFKTFQRFRKIPATFFSAHPVFSTLIRKNIYSFSKKIKKITKNPHIPEIVVLDNELC